MLNKNIVIEIKEDKIKNTHALKSFIDMYRKHDFFIALDDFGIGYSSFDRLEFIQPDIVKVDRSLVYNVHNNYYWVYCCLRERAYWPTRLKYPFAAVGDYQLIHLHSSGFARESAVG